MGAFNWAQVLRHEYTHTVTLARTIVERRPTAVAHHFLGEQLMLAGQSSEAEQELHAAYFAAVRTAIARAKRSVFILGWDFDNRTRLVPQGARDGYPEELGDFLNEVVRRNRELEMYVLSWDFAMVFAAQREWVPLYKLGWRAGPRPPCSSAAMACCSIRGSATVSISRPTSSVSACCRTRRNFAVAVRPGPIINRYCAETLVPA
jgi:hypothetical protein